jgi:hypothetical protein
MAPTRSFCFAKAAAGNDDHVDRVGDVSNGPPDIHASLARVGRLRLNDEQVEVSLSFVIVPLAAVLSGWAT